MANSESSARLFSVIYIYYIYRNLCVTHTHRYYIVFYINQQSYRQQMYSIVNKCKKRKMPSCVVKFCQNHYRSMVEALLKVPYVTRGTPLPYLIWLDNDLKCLFYHDRKKYVSYLQFILINSTVGLIRIRQLPIEHTFSTLKTNID